MMPTLHLIATWAVDIAGTVTLAFLALWGLLIGLAWLRDWIKRPLIALPGNRCLVRFKDDEDRQRTLARMDRRGFEGRHIGKGQWHLVKRKKDFTPPPARKKLPNIPLDNNPRRGID